MKKQVTIDIRVDVEYFEHAKTARLATRAGPLAPFHLIRLWAWAAKHCPADGALGDLSDLEIEAMAKWPGEPGVFSAACIAAGFIEGEINSRSLHDWNEHQPWVVKAPTRIAKATYAALVKQHGAKKAKRLMRVTKGATSSAQTVPVARSGDLFSSAPAPAPSPAPSPAPKEATSTDSRVDGGGKKPPTVVHLNGHRKKPATKSGPSWTAYAAAFRKRYGVAPPSNAKSNALLCQLVDRIGAEDAPPVAEFYLAHQSAFYVQRGHPVEMLVKDAEKLRTEWATGRTVTQTAARQGDRSATTGQAARELIREINDGRG